MSIKLCKLDYTKNATITNRTNTDIWLSTAVQRNNTIYVYYALCATIGMLSADLISLVALTPNMPKVPDDKIVYSEFLYFPTYVCQTVIPLSCFRSIPQLMALKEEVLCCLFGRLDLYVPDMMARMWGWRFVGSM